MTSAGRATLEPARQAALPDAPVPRRDLPMPNALPTAPRGRNRSLAALIFVFMAAIGLRAWIAWQPAIGHAQDLNFFARWIRGLADHGLSGFFAAESFCDYPPLMLLLFRGLGWAADVIAQGRADAAELRFGVKALASIADVLIGVLILVEGRRLLNIRLATVAASLFLLNPVSIYHSAFWGQVDSVYAALVLGGLLALARRRWLLCGALALASLGAKFQAVALLPLLIFEVYRIGGWRGLGRMLGGAALAAAVIAAPFVATGTLAEALERSYVRTVGQYNELSKNAYNVWYLTPEPKSSDTAPPAAIVQLVAAGRSEVAADESWLFRLTWRNISLLVFALGVAVVLSLYSLRPGPLARFAAAGALALCFFLFPTEMHERYAFPAIALLPLWAAVRPAAERVYWILSGLLLLNLAAVLSPAVLGPQIAASILLVFAVLLAAMVWSRREKGAAPAVEVPLDEAPPDAGIPGLIRVFRFATAAAVMAALGLSAWLAPRCLAAERPPAATPGVTWLGEVAPRHAQQGWKSLAIDRAVTGGVLRIGVTYYTRGLGTHAPARLVYSIPDDAAFFEAIAGIDFAARNAGSAVVAIQVDGRTVHTTSRLSGGAAAESIRVPVHGGRELTILVEDGGDGRRADHVNLVLARFRGPEP